MRSSVVRENDDPLRFAKHFFGSGFFRRGALRALSRNRERGCEGRPETVGYSDDAQRTDASYQRIS
jgi:hypothetical protein